MRQTFSQSMAWLHTWSGLVAGWLLFMIFATGTLAVYVPEITHWMQPEAVGGAAGPPERSIALAETYLRANAADAKQWEIELPSARQPLLHLHWHGADHQETERALDPHTGKELFVRATEGGEFFNELHYQLRAGVIGRWVVILLGIVLVASIVSGIIIHKRIFKDFFTFRPGKGQRSWLDAHNVAGVMTLPFLLMISYTGVAISAPMFLWSVVQTRFDGDARAPRAQVLQSFARPASGQPAATLPLAGFYVKGVEAIGAVDGIALDNPNDKAALVRVLRSMNWRISAVGDHAAFDGATGVLVGAQTTWSTAAYAYRTLVGIHLGQFGGPIVRVLYFGSGLLGCVLIATGLVLFVEKRKVRSEGALAQFVSVSARLNVGTVAGVLVASITYLWINRVLPAELPDRSTWEVSGFFAVWLVMLTHGLCRPARTAWVEQLSVAAFLCLALPLISHMRVGAGLLVGGPHASLETTALVMGAILGITAWRLAKRHNASPRS